jgi:DNA integrity scanning protein DisA with diadenylate cyclase activity
MFKIIMNIVDGARERRHGCTLVIDVDDQLREIPGQKLEHPIDLQKNEFLELGKSLSKVDGALHIGADLHLHAFACLLDGRSVPGEDRSRGARFNSALRFTAIHQNLIVVVVSSDRPVSVFEGGVELTATCDWKPVCDIPSRPPTLIEWFNGR